MTSRLFRAFALLCAFLPFLSYAQAPTAADDGSGTMALSSRFFGLYNSSTTYAYSDVVYTGTLGEGGTYKAWYSRQSNNTGNTPGAAGSSLWWSANNYDSPAPGLQTNGTYNNLQDLLNIVCTGNLTCVNANGTTTFTFTDSSSTGLGGTVTGTPSFQLGPRFAISSYIATGDSITYGVGVANSSDDYVSKIAKVLGISPTNLGQSGYTSEEWTRFEIFPSLNPTPSNNPLVTALILHNDLHWCASDGNANNVGNSSNTPGCLSNAYMSMMSGLTWATIPINAKVLGNAPSSTSGTWAADTSINQYGVSSSSQGASEGYSFTTTNPSEPLYIWYGGTDGDGGTGTVAIDGSQAATIATASTSGQCICTIGQHNTTVWGQRIVVPSAGSHTLTVAVTSSSGTVHWVGFGLPPQGAPAEVGSPAIFVGDPIYENGYNDQAATNSFTSQLDTEIALLHGDGLLVGHIPTQSYLNVAVDMSGSNTTVPNGMGDENAGTTCSAVTSGNVGQHPNICGHQHIADAFLGTIQPSAVGGSSSQAAAGGVASGSIYARIYSTSGTIDASVTTAFVTATATMTLPVPAGLGTNQTSAPAQNNQLYVVSYGTAVATVQPASGSSLTVNGATVNTFTIPVGMTAIFTTAGGSSSYAAWNLTGLFQGTSGSAAGVSAAANGVAFPAGSAGIGTVSAPGDTYGQVFATPQLSTSGGSSQILYPYVYGAGATGTPASAGLFMTAANGIAQNFGIFGVNLQKIFYVSAAAPAGSAYVDSTGILHLTQTPEVNGTPVGSSSSSSCPVSGTPNITNETGVGSGSGTTLASGYYNSNCAFSASVVVGSGSAVGELFEAAFANSSGTATPFAEAPVCLAASAGSTPAVAIHASSNAGHVAVVSDTALAAGTYPINVICRTN